MYAEDAFQVNLPTDYATSLRTINKKTNMSDEMAVRLPVPGIPYTRHIMRQGGSIGTDGFACALPVVLGVGIRHIYRQLPDKAIDDLSVCLPDDIHTSMKSVLKRLQLIPDDDDALVVSLPVDFSVGLSKV